MNLPDVPTSLMAKEVANSYYNDDVAGKCKRLYKKCLKELDQNKYSRCAFMFETWESNPYYADNIMQKLIRAGYLVEKSYDDGSYYLTITNPFLDH